MTYRLLDANCEPIAGGKRAGNRSCHDRRNASVGLLRKSRERSLHASGLRRPDQILHQGGHSPAAWKAVMGLAASHAAMAAPMQAVTEISLGILLVIGLLTRPVAFIAFLYLASLWVSEWGTSWIWELLVPVMASLSLTVGRAGRAWGIDALLARRWPSSPWW